MYNLSACQETRDKVTKKKRVSQPEASADMSREHNFNTFDTTFTDNGQIIKKYIIMHSKKLKFTVQLYKKDSKIHG